MATEKVVFLCGRVNHASDMCGEREMMMNVLCSLISWMLDDLHLSCILRLAAVMNAHKMFFGNTKVKDAASSLTSSLET